ncbi:MAG: hypothetical protein K0S68_423 [Candidatus Saccharibacteria bacterium]|jgi:hypothetical protein|nr:hypothetical protein [Candidatus Saccharibacteria bacterium]
MNNPINRLNAYVDQRNPVNRLLDFVEKRLERGAPVFLGAVTAIYAVLVFDAGLFLGATPSVGYFAHMSLGTIGTALVVGAMARVFKAYHFEFGAIQRASAYLVPFVLIIAGLSASDAVTSVWIVAQVTPQVTAFVALVAIPVATRLLDGIGAKFDRLYA